jgi:glutamate formiminotransferase / 5-formyltetrahydrofolate cyclo-ligase
VEAVLECVVNVSEGRDPAVLDALADAAGGALLDVHADAHHHRSVFTLAGADAVLEPAVRRLAAEAVGRLDLRRHQGAHPRIGVVDVVPFVPLEGSTIEAAVEARDRFAAWAAADLGVPCFLYGPEVALPEVRGSAFRSGPPDTGPAEPHPTAGAMAVGARHVLVAYNLWLAPGVPVAEARRIAAGLRQPAVRALGLDLGGRAQVSCNLLDAATVGPAAIYDAVACEAAVERAELVGLAPAAVVDAVPAPRWAELDLEPGRTIEARLEIKPWRPTPGGARSSAGGGGGGAPAR